MKCVSATLNSQTNAKKCRQFSAAYLEVIPQKADLRGLFRSLGQIVAIAMLMLAALLAAPDSACAANVLSFNAADNFITTPAKITTVNFTLEAWVKPTAYQAEQQVLSQYSGGGGRMIMGVKSGKAGLFVGGTWVYSDAPISLNTWTHIAVTRNGAAWSFYINGVFDSTKTGNNKALDNTTLLMCRLTPTNGPGFRGAISDLRVWNTLRSAPQILASYNTRLTGGRERIDLLLAAE
ncbi:MAG: LamG domain-containing protein [Kiritimatiellae bacterium]|nr:LamG domain-containing protein [Kiritimatiellia bacterium]